MVFLKRVAESLFNDPSGIGVGQSWCRYPSEANDFGGWPWLVETESLGKKRNGGVDYRRHHSKPSDYCANPGFSSIFLLLGCLL
uniref:Uncharacterized protein n=1 Tax=Fagus sylvatica TaxID=28930 RepID=A0A2N9G635_FAGSY